MLSGTEREKDSSLKKTMLKIENGEERTRKDQAPKNTNVEVATPSQESQHQEPIASLSNERVLRMKQESKLDVGSALPPPPINTSYLNFGDLMFSFLFGSE